MGLRAHDPALRCRTFARDASFFAEQHQTKKWARGTVPASLLQQPHPSRPRHAISNVLQIASINSASSAAISGLTPRHRALTAAPTWGGLSCCLARWPPPRQGEAKLGAKLQCILTQTSSPPCDGQRQTPRETVPACLWRCRQCQCSLRRLEGVVDDGQWTTLDQKHLDSFAETATSWHQIFKSTPTRAAAKMPRRPSLHISDRPARIGQSHLGRVDSASPLSTKAASRSRGILETSLHPRSPAPPATCRGGAASCEGTGWPYKHVMAAAPHPRRPETDLFSSPSSASSELDKPRDSG